MEYRTFNENDIPYACIVPNSKLLSANPQDQDWSSDYIPRLVKAARLIRKKGLNLKIVQHEYKRPDSKLVKFLAKEICGCEVVRHFDPLKLKEVLGGAEFVIASRFHSLVSALSMGVPSITLGWAHKYDALMNDFGVPDFIHCASDSVEQLYGLIENILRNHDRLSGTITQRSAYWDSEVEKMWERVYSLLTA